VNRATSVIVALAAASALVAGCAAKPRQAVPTAQVRARAMTEASTKPSAKADLTIEQIEPRPMLVKREPATQPSRAPLEALDLFAEARDAMLRAQRLTAINKLEQAVRLDPESYQLRFWLGQAHTSGGMANDQSIAAYEAAVAIDPDHIIVHCELGRQYLAKNETQKALEHLLLATQTSEYGEDASLAAVADFYLAKALQQSGYDAAALQGYEKLIRRLQSGGLRVRGSPELAYLVAQPEGLYVQVGELLEKRGRPDEAVKLYSLAVERRAEEFSVHAHLIRALASAGRRDEATQRAADVVRRFRASPDAIALLKEIFQKVGGDDAVARELTRLRRERPNDRTLLYALVDVLTAQGKPTEAANLLANAAKQARYETELVRRLFKLYDAANDVDGAARLLIEGLAARPDNARDLSPMWTQLLRPWRRNHLTVSKLEALDVAPEALASKMFWLSQMALIWNREALSRSSLEQAVKQVPPFAPAYRALIARYWSREDWDAKRKEEAAQVLIASVERQGDQALTAELRGVNFLNSAQAQKAAEAFAMAQELGGDGADLRLAYAMALQVNGETNRAEQVLTKLAEQQPTCEEAYLQLFRAYLQREQPDRALEVLKTWLRNDPASINGHILEATVYTQAKATADAERTLNDLFAREPDNAEVLAALTAFYMQTGRIEEYIAKLEAQRTEHPENRTAVEQLVLLYATQKRLAEATRVLDAARESAMREGDADLLYYIAGLYTRVGAKDTTEQILEQIVQQVDPQHAPACNDLGYNWADQGKNLSRAESLIRVAVQKEPDNHSFLDSLGWVLYKRGRFEQARTALQDAVDAASFPDPVVLDHLGDTLYRLSAKEKATAQWKRSQERMTRHGGVAGGDERDDLRQLRLQLQQKIKQAEAGQPASVAPTAEEPAPRQAKN
jgi:Tfp pilus assembly protein PilF